VTFRFAGESTSLRDAYLEPWGRGLEDLFELALRVGGFTHALAWARLREFLGPEDRRTFAAPFGEVLRGALERAGKPR
jgi:hypothetical protein